MKEKIDLASEFSMRYSSNEFINFLTSVNTSMTNDYLKSWQYIKSHSLQRSSNLIIFINELKKHNFN